MYIDCLVCQHPDYHGKESISFIVAIILGSRERNSTLTGTD